MDNCNARSYADLAHILSSDVGVPLQKVKRLLQRMDEILEADIKNGKSVRFLGTSFRVISVTRVDEGGRFVSGYALRIRSNALKKYIKLLPAGSLPLVDNEDVSLDSVGDVDY